MDIIRPIKGVFLDIGWTMDAPASGHWMLTTAFFDLVGRQKINAIPKPKWESAFAECMRYLEENHLVQTEQEECERFYTFYEMLSDLLPELDISNETISEIAFDKVYNDKNYIFYDDVKPALLELAKHFKLGVISDTWPSAKRIQLERAGIYHLFDSITFSCNLGVYKPHRKMYEHALSTMGIAPERTVFVDDTILCLEGAKSFGIQPVLMTRNGLPDGHEQYIKVKDFVELVALLKE